MKLFFQNYSLIYFQAYPYAATNFKKDQSRQTSIGDSFYEHKKEIPSVWKVGKKQTTES